MSKRGRGGEGIASDGHSAGRKGRVQVFTTDLEEGKRRSQNASQESLKDGSLLLFKPG